MLKIVITDVNRLGKRAPNREKPRLLNVDFASYLHCSPCSFEKWQIAQGHSNSILKYSFGLATLMKSVST